MSRATIRTPEARAKILASMSGQAKPFEVAAAEAGISPRAAWMWKRDDPEFAEEVARAKFVGAGGLHDKIAAGDDKGEGFGKGRAALELAKRLYPKHYGDKIQVGIERELDRILDVAERVCSPEDFERLLAGIAALDGEGEAEEES